MDPAQMLCISEYMPSGNLEVALRRDNERKDGKPRVLGWHFRGHGIALDVARGLAFLHSNQARRSPMVLAWNTPADMFTAVCEHKGTRRGLQATTQCYFDRQPKQDLREL